MNHLQLSAVGDILLSDKLINLKNETNTYLPLKYVSNNLRKSDVVFGNLECPLSNRGKAVPNKCCIFSPKEAINELYDAGFNILSLANNHIFDYGYEGFEDTLQVLKENNIVGFGAGEKLSVARKPAIININNVSIGFLGYSWNFIETINATDNQYGTAPLKEKIILSDIKELKDKTDVVVVSLHWGYERERYPLPSQRKLAHKIIESGASLILGHHSHVLQGIEEYKDGIIVYSLGNFIFPDISYDNYNLIQKLENKESIIFNCNISQNGIESTEIVPIKSNEYSQPIISTNNSKIESLEKIREISKPLGSSDYFSFWRTNRVRKDLPDVNHSDFTMMLYKSKIGRQILKLV